MEGEIKAAPARTRDTQPRPMNLHWFRDEAVYDPLLLSYRVDADRIMLGMCVFLQFVCTISAVLSHEWLPLAVVGVPMLAVVSALVTWRPGALSTRIVVACAFMVFAA